MVFFCKCINLNFIRKDIFKTTYNSKEKYMPTYKEILKGNNNYDLAIEAKETIAEDDISGVNFISEDREGIKTSWVEVLNETGEKSINKKMGIYITIESDLINDGNLNAHDSLTDILCTYLRKILDKYKFNKILVVGLGNENVTADSLGPKVVNKILVTRHLMDTLPEELGEDLISVSAVAPGVMGQTGIETAETIFSIVKSISPDLVIAIDALASRQVSRINSTIQITNTGINPGSGVGNKRKGLNQESLDVPVIAIGVPTVIDATTLINTGISNLLDILTKKITNANEIENIIDSLSDDERNLLLDNTLSTYSDNLFVTPKEVDDVIDRLSKVISKAINLSIQKSISPFEIDNLLY